jgi:hypothetical protein
LAGYLEALASDNRFEIDGRLLRLDSIAKNKNMEGKGGYFRETI